MNRIILAALALLISSGVYGQELKNNLYYYNNEQVLLPINYNCFFIVDNGPVNIANVFQQYGYAIDTLDEGTNTDELDSMWWQVVKVTNTTLNLSEYNSLRNQLKNGDNLIVEPVLDDSIFSPLTHYFYVHLNCEADTFILDSMANVTDVTIVKEVPYTPLWYELKTRTSSLGNCLEMANYFHESGLFDYAEPGVLYRFELATCTTVTPDPDYNLQWALENSTNSNYDINACQAWDITTGSNNIKLAIFDNGLHDNINWAFKVPEYANNLSIPTNSFDAATSTSPARLGSNHGVYSAGIIAANHNGQPLMGIAPNTTLMDISHHWIWGQSLNPSAEMTAGFNWGWQNGAHIINNS